MANTLAYGEFDTSDTDQFVKCITPSSGCIAKIVVLKLNLMNEIEVQLDF